MPNKYANLVGTNRISDEYDKINEGFDKVEQDMDSKAPIDSPTFTNQPKAPTPPEADNSTRIATTEAVNRAAGKVQTDLNSHKADDVRHMTTADRNKLAGIQTGAQVNTVTSVAGRTGAVTVGWEDVQSKPASTPSAIDGAVTKVGGIQTGAQVNQNAVAKVNDIPAGNPSDAVTIAGGTGIAITTNPATKTVIITATGDSTPGAHASSHLSDGSDPIPAATETRGGLMSPTDKQDLGQLKVKVAEGQTIPAPINRGPNIINTSQASGATVQVKGRTLANILGNAGGCESLTDWFTVGDAILSTTVKRSGNNSLKFSATNTATYALKDFNYKLDVNKQYVMGAWVFIESFTTGIIPLRVYEPGGTTTQRYTVNANTSVIGSWQFVYIKIPAANTVVGEGFRIYFGLTSNATAVAYFDEIRLYEVSAVDFTAIGTTITGDAIDAYLPYVDGVKHTRGLTVMMQGKNMLPPLPQWTAINANLTIQGPYKAVLVAPSTTNQITSIDIPVVAGQTYHVHHKGTGRVLVHKGKGTGGAIISTPTFTVDASFNGYACIRLDNAITAGTFTFEDVQLELGTIATAFAPYNPSYAHADTILASNVDRSIADSYDSATRQVFRRIRSDYKLDRSMSWVFHSSFTGYKRIVRNVPADYVNDSGIAVRYDGLVLRQDVVNNAQNAPNEFRLSTAYGGVVLSVANTDSGWVDGVNPNNNAVAALSNGWRANGNNGSTYTSWVSILTGAAPATNSEAYVSNNKAPGWDAWATLDYVLAKPETEQLLGDLGGLSLDAGGNTVELIEGVIVREKVNPVLVGGYYQVNRPGTPESHMKNRVRSFLNIYKDKEVDTQRWVRDSSASEPKMSILPSDYDSTKPYFADYIVLDKYAYTVNSIDAVLTYQSSLGGAVAKSTQDIAALQRHEGVQDFALDYIQAAAENANRDIAAATSTPTPGALVEYDASGRIKVNLPVANNDAANKQMVDGAQTAAETFTNGKVGNLVTLLTSAKGNTVAAINELFQSVGNGKMLLSEALIDRGLKAASASDTFAKQAADIKDFMIARSGIVWTRITDPPAPSFVVDLAYGLGMFMIMCLSGNNNTISFYTSANGGDTWVSRSFAVSGGETVENLTFVNNRFITTSGTRVFSSTSGTSFSLNGTLPSGAYARRVPLYAASPGYIAVGGYYGIHTSTNLSSWTQRYSDSSASTDKFNDAAFGNGRFVVVGDKGRCVHSSDGINWSAGSGLGNRDYYSVAFGNGKFIATGINGYTATSTDGITWTETPSTNGLTIRLDRIVFAGGLFIAVSQQNTPFGLASRDGVNWTSISFDNAISRVGVAYNDTLDRYMVVSHNATAHISDKVVPK
ncbi:WD40/YVTN/BNR-like repeat-containing protein [Paenibacillus paeoniae]|uniref:Uncharacterized protein n=1 Tax=Paenibacillus paeoniae TaxID=2292705 RepID=A0A371P0F6_9BACL|nr:hypothetical protein [Paenibacillus paeoniae]REK69351.1 hypothetical protein DX130_24635 [Paenibacillus paeoniae]